MSKDKEWLKERLTYYKREVNFEQYEIDTPERYNSVGKLDAINEMKEFVEEMDEPEKVVVPEWFSEWIEETLKNIEKGNLILRMWESYANGNLSNEKENWLAENKVLATRAILDGYSIEQPKTYRFTLNAFHEIDVNATSLEEAQKEADKTWNQYFVRQRDFGEAEFEGEVDEEGVLTE